MDVGCELPCQPTIGAVAAVLRAERARVGALLHTYLDVEVFLAGQGPLLSLSRWCAPQGGRKPLPGWVWEYAPHVNQSGFA